jgi:hypothetical protein
MTTPAQPLRAAAAPQVATQQGAAQGAAAVHDEHAAFAGGIHGRLHQRVVLEAFDRGHRSAEGAHGTEVVEHGRQHAEGAGAVTLVRVAQVAGGKRRFSRGSDGGVHGCFPLVTRGEAKRLSPVKSRPPEGKAPSPERSKAKNAMKKTTSPREKTHFSLGDAFFLL